MEDDIEDSLVNDLNNITVGGKKQFTFKKKNIPPCVPEKTVDEIEDDTEEEEEESLSANFSLEDLETSSVPVLTTPKPSNINQVKKPASVAKSFMDSESPKFTKHRRAARVILTDDEDEDPSSTREEAAPSSVISPTGSESPGLDSASHKNIDHQSPPYKSPESLAAGAVGRQSESPMVFVKPRRARLIISDDEDEEGAEASVNENSLVRASSAGAACLELLNFEKENGGKEEDGDGDATLLVDSDSSLPSLSSDTRQGTQWDSPTVIPPSDEEDDYDGDKDIAVLTDRLNLLPLGKKPVTTREAQAPKKTIFLNEAPPIEKKTYAYNPADVRQQDFYGDVQRTICLLAKTIEEMPSPEDQEEIVLPKRLVPLFTHQVYGLRWLSWREREFPGGGILADEMGLGKTIMIIALIMKSKMEMDQNRNENIIDDEREVGDRIQAKTTLVVCPVGCIVQWEQEIKSKGNGLSVYAFHGATERKRVSAVQLAQYDVVLSTYATVLSDVGADDDARTYRNSKLRRLYWRRIVLDESHNIRNPKAKCTQAICKLGARHRWAVTGTPIHNYPSDFFSLAKFLRMKPFDDAKTWDFWIGMKQIRKAVDAQERLSILGKALILRRTKQEVEVAGGNVGVIPPKTVEKVEIELSAEERRVYDYLMQFAKNMFAKFLEEKEKHQRELQAAAMTYSAAPHRSRKQKDDGLPDDIRFSHLFALLIRLRQCAVLPHLIHTMLEDEEIDEDVSFDENNDDHIISMVNPVFDRMYLSSKLKKIIEDLEKLRQIGEQEERPMDKVVLVSSWTVTLQIFYDHLRARGFSCIFITGKEDANERALNMEKFNKRRNSYQICLLSLMAGGVGLNLVGGNHVFFIEPHWNPQMELQAQDRVHRFGQTKDVTIKRYISEDTVESRILEVQAGKVELADGVLNNTNRKKGAGLSLQQLRKLFE